MNGPTTTELDRRGAVLMALGASVVTIVAAALLVPWDWVPGGDLTPLRAADLFTADEITRAEEFAATRRVVAWSSYAVSLAVAAALGFTPLGSRLVKGLTGRAPWWASVVGGTLVVLLIGRLATLPFSLVIRSQNLEYDLTRQPFGGWLSDVVKGLGVSWAVTALVLLVVVAVARRDPRRWFAWVGGVAALLTVAGSVLYPVVVEPLFNDFRPLPDGALRTSVLTLADGEGVDVTDVLVADASRRTTTLNAYVSGLSGTRRVVLYDNLLREAGPAEVRSVVAHELAHAKHRDVLVGTLLGAGGALLAAPLLALVLGSRRLLRRTGVISPGDPRAVALLLALSAVATLAVSPLSSTVSRAIEARADRDALAATGDAAAFVAMQRKLAVQAVRDPTPPRWSQLWFGTHPTVLERAGLPASLREAR